VRYRRIGIVAFLVAGAWLVSALTASAQSQVGFRAGVSGDPTQFYFGGHVETPPLADHLSFRPNVEVGLGDHTTLVAFNIELVYRIPLRNNPWTIYVGGGPAANWYSYSSDNPHHSGSEFGGGLNVLVGLEHQGGLFTELKVGAIDSPSIKFAVGYSTRF
jgi:hypothetical protein